MDEEDKKMVLSALRATVASSQGGVELHALNSDYRELEGQNIPFKALGFSSLEAYIRSLSDHFMIVSKQGSLHVLAKKNEALAHIQDMISSQRVKRKPARKGKVSRGKYGNYSTSFNNRHPPKPATYSGSSNSFRRNGSNNKPTRPTYPAGSKPWSSSHDYRSNDSNKEPSPSVRKQSPVRRRSPPRSRIEPATSTARKKDPSPAEVATRRKESIRVPDLDKLPANIQKMPEYHHKKTEESAVYRPPVVSNLVSKMMSQIRVNDDMSHINTARQDPMLNLQITLPNDLYTPPAGLVDEDLESLPSVTDSELPLPSPNVPYLDLIVTSNDLCPPSPPYHELELNNFNSHDRSTIVQHLESQLNNYPSDLPSHGPSPNMPYLNSLLRKLKQQGPHTLASPENAYPSDPSRLGDATDKLAHKTEPLQAPDMRYLRAMLSELKSKESTKPDTRIDYQHMHKVKPPLVYEETILDLGLSSNRSTSAFQPYISEDKLDKEVLMTTKNMYQRLPTAAPPIYSHPPPMDPHQVYTPSFRSPLSPSYSMQNGATSSKSSSPEVYLELPPGATPEEQLTHVCKYLYNDEPGIVIRDRKPDPKRPVFTYYAFIQVGSHSRISTLPNEFSTKEEAKSSVITLALNQLNKLKDERMSKTLKKTTDKLNLLIDRIYSLACDSSNGMVASKIEELYEAKYGEILPDDWTQNPEVLNHPRLEVNRNPISTIIYAKTVQMPQYSASASLPPLQLPEENEWPVFVSMMPSVSNVFVRLADDACDDYFKMCEDLDRFMSEATRPAPVLGVEVGELYCLNDDGVWHRVRVESADEQILVKMIDHGEEGPRAIHELYPLYDMFRTIPAQAIELYLPECQVFAEHFDHSEVEREIVGKTLVAVIQSRETLTATLYNTAEDPNVNINHFIFDQICGWFNESSLPEENMFNGSVFVSFISTNENCIYVQVESLMFQYLTNSIRELITTSDVQEYVVKSTADLTDCREDIFLAKYDLDGEYYRASLLDVNPISNNVSVRFIDYGNTSLVSCTNLIKLFETSESHLCLIPAQAKEVKLVGLEHFTPDVMNKLTTYVNGIEPVMLKMTAGRAQLHKRDHDGKIVNINALVLGSPLNTSGFKGSPYKTLANYKEFDASPLEPPTIPPLNHMIDVLVETVVSPSNFWIRPQESYNKWVDLVEEMEEFYSEQDKTLKPIREHIKVGASFAFYYEELELWQRVTINSQISPECVALFLVDFGKIITANTSELHYLAPQFRKLPAIAIKSKLHDIKPAFGDWNPEDILRFQQMCDPIKVFKCRIENCTPDLISHKEDVQLSVRLLDTHHSDVDLDLSVVLVVEGRAKMNE